MPSASFSSFGTPTLQALEVLGLRDRDRLRQLDRRRVGRVAAGDDLVEARAVADGLRDRADLVEARGEGDDPGAADRAVGGPQADEAAERRRLLDRAARVGAERPRAPARRRPRPPSRPTSRRGRARGPTGCGSGRRPSSRWTSPSRTRPCSSCRAAGDPPRGSGPRPWSRRPGCSPARIFEPAVVSTPLVEITSLSAIGTPSPSARSTVVR